MQICKYSRDVCRAAEILDIINPTQTKELEKKYCYGNQKTCPQFGAIESSGLGFYRDVKNVIDSGMSIFERAVKGSTS